MVIKRKAIETVRGNDFLFGIENYDDDDWTLRLRIAGFKIALVGSSFVHHIGSVSFNKDPYIFNNALKTNYKKLIKKWNIPSFDEVVKENMISNVTFQQEDHFCPIRIEQFKKPIKKL